MVRIGAIVLKVSDIRRAATFWSEALGYQRTDHLPWRALGVAALEYRVGAGRDPTRVEETPEGSLPGEQRR